MPDRLPDGYVENRGPKGRVLVHREEGLLLFRYYSDGEPGFPCDPMRTRTFLDLRGVMEADNFDGTLLRADSPA